jgi:cytochrome c2
MPARVFTASLILLSIARIAHAADAGNAAEGKAYFKQICAQCHSAEPGDGGGEIGPSLIGVFGRPAGVGDERFAYSQALKDSKLTWNREALDRFLNDPAATVPGTTMPIPVPEKKDRDNLIAYLESLLGSAK